MLKNLFLFSSTVIIAYLARYYLKSSWWFQKVIDQDDFQVYPEAPINLVDIPTTYYKNGELLKVLPEWHPRDGGKAHMHLYRLADGETFEFDRKQVDDVRVLARPLSNANCSRTTTVICNGCDNAKTKDTMTMRMGDIFDRTYGTSWFSSFTKLEVADMGQGRNKEKDNTVTATVSSTLIDENIYDRIFPSFGVNRVWDRIHTFVSNFDYDRISTAVHCNAMATSAAIQLIGSKTWLFFPPDVYLSEDGLEAKPTRLSHFPTHSPRKPYNAHIYTSRPGDILFFTENYAHAVYTYAGPNYLITYRKNPELANIYGNYNPLHWFHQFGFFIFSSGLESSEKPDIVSRALMFMNNACTDFYSAWDTQMMDIIRAQKSGADFYKPANRL